MDWSTPEAPQRVDDIVAALAKLLDGIGPVVLVGHSFGAALCFKLAERCPRHVHAVAALASAAAEAPNPAFLSALARQPEALPPAAVRALFANSRHFPTAFFDEYYNSLVTVSHHVRNAACGLTEDFKVDPSCIALWQEIPVLYLIAEDDATVPEASSRDRAATVPATGQERADCLEIN